MKFLSSIDINASALTAQRKRMDIISQNIANATTTRTDNGGPYRRKMTLLNEQKPQRSFGSVLSQKVAAGGGVKVSQVVEDQSPFRIVHDPFHPDANENGDVRLPNVDTTQEMLDMMAATRAYDSNITALNATKNMALKALEIGR